jgi:hypothetical protein
MSTARQRRRGTTAQHSTFTGLLGEITIDTDKHVAVVHDGLTAGGFPLALATSASPVETQIHAATGKTTPIDADEFGIVDTAASNVLKKLTWANLKATLWTAWGALIAAGTGKTTPVDADTFAMADSAASNATKKLTWANLKATLNTYLSGLGSLAIVAGDIVYGSGAATLARLAKGSDGQVLTLASGVPAWATASAAGVTARNRIVNPAMQISSINGNTSGTTSGYSPADNWTKFHVSSAGTLTVQRVQSVTPKGAKDRIRLTVTVADASLAAGEFLTISQNMIGQEVADFQYGSASAKQGLLRFLFKGPAGTYAIHLGNSATNRSYVALFTISAGQANTDTIQTFTIPGDTTGTWLTDTGTGITLDIVLACGSTFQGTTGWQAGNLLGTSGVSNGMATGAAVFEIGEAGFYLDVASLATFPTWELPSFTADYDYLAVTTPFVSYTPTTQGLGSPTINSAVSRRVGDCLHVKWTITAGTPTAAEMRVSFGFGGVDGNILSSSTKLRSGTNYAGLPARSIAASYIIYALVEPGVSYLTFGYQDGTHSSLTKVNGSDITGAGTILSLEAMIPIAGW